MSVAKHRMDKPAPHMQGERASGRGRRAAAPASPLAVFIVEHMQVASLSRGELAERLQVSASTLSRLLSGKIHWTHVPLRTLASALHLAEADWARLVDLYGQATPRAHTARPPSANPSQSDTQPLRRRGRRPRPAASSAGALLEPLMVERHITRAALAQALGVQESTVTRLMSGAHASSHAMSAHGVSDALGLQGIARREFIQRAVALGVFALVSEQGAPAVTRYRSFDLDQFEDDLKATQRLLDGGLAQQALARAQTLYEASLAAAFPSTHKVVASRRIEAALLLGRAQEAALTWGAERAGRTAQTYDHIDRHILGAFAPREFAYYYARLYERRAPLYRELGDYAESIQQFTLAIELFMPYVDDVGLLVALYRHRAHVWATQGREREWRTDLDNAARVANRAAGAARAQLEGLIIYSEAEGYKRLAGIVPSGDRPRQRLYARNAIASFQSARALRLDTAESHHILLDVSLAQAYLWLDPDESARQAREAYQRALVIYPSLARKCELTIAQAMGRRSGAEG